MATASMPRPVCLFGVQLYLFWILLSAPCLSSLWQKRRVECDLALVGVFPVSRAHIKLGKILVGHRAGLFKGSENFSNSFITRYSTARPAVMSDVHFRHKMFPILIKKVGVHPLTFCSKSIITYMESKPLRVERLILD